MSCVPTVTSEGAGLMTRRSCQVVRGITPTDKTVSPLCLVRLWKRAGWDKRVVGHEPVVGRAGAPLSRWPIPRYAALDARSVLALWWDDDGW